MHQEGKAYFRAGWSLAKESARYLFSTLRNALIFVVVTFFVVDPSMAKLNHAASYLARIFVGHPLPLHPQAFTDFLFAAFYAAAVVLYFMVGVGASGCIALGLCKIVDEDRTKDTPLAP